MIATRKIHANGMTGGPACGATGERGLKVSQHGVGVTCATCRRIRGLDKPDTCIYGFPRHGLTPCSKAHGS